MSHELKIEIESYEMPSGAACVFWRIGNAESIESFSDRRKAIAAARRFIAAVRKSGKIEVEK